MSQNMNSDFSAKLKHAVETIETDVIANVKNGLVNTAEMTKATGSDAFIRSGEALCAGTEELLKSAAELVEVLNKIAAQYDRVSGALS